MREEVGAIKGSMKLARRMELAVGLFALILLSVLFSLPLMITVGDSLKSFLQVYAVPRIWFPRPPQWRNFVDIFHVLPFHLFFINTICITAMSLTGQVMSSAVVGYSFARLRWPFRDFMFIVLLSTLMLPGQVTMIPIFLIFKKFNLINTWFPLFLPAFFGGGVFNIFLLRQFFKTIPVALEDAAKLDGCAPPRIMFTIMLPLAKPALVTITVLGFIGSWNDFMNPLIYLSDYTRYPVSLGIWMFKGAQSMFPHYVMAASLMSITPVLCLFFAAQRYFVKGIVMSGIKG